MLIMYSWLRGLLLPKKHIVRYTNLVKDNSFRTQTNKREKLNAR